MNIIYLKNFFVKNYILIINIFNYVFKIRIKYLYLNKIK